MLRLCHIKNTACRPCLLTHNSDQFSWEIPRAAAAQADTCGNNAQEQIPGTSRSQCWNFCDGVEVSAALIKASCWKAKLETWLKGRQCWLAELPAVQHLVLRAGTALGAERESQPQIWLLWGCITRTDPGGNRGADKEWTTTVVTQEPPGCGYCPSSAAFQTEEPPAVWLGNRTLQAALSCGKWLRLLLHTHFHAWLKTKEMKYPWTCRHVA